MAELLNPAAIVLGSAVTGVAVLGPAKVAPPTDLVLYVLLLLPAVLTGVLVAVRALVSFPRLSGHLGGWVCCAALVAAGEGSASGPGGVAASPAVTWSPVAGSSSPELAEVHGVQLDEIERQRTLVMGILLGESGSTTISKVAERTGQHWARQLVGKVPAATLRQINSVLGKNFITKYGTKQGIIVLGRVIPFGIGAVTGGGANATVAAVAVRAARRAFGPARQAWPEASLDPALPTLDSQVIPPDQCS